MPRAPSTPGPQSRIRCVAHLLGIGINYFVGVDFNAFKQAVDAVGGVNIDVPVGVHGLPVPGR